MARYLLDTTVLIDTLRGDAEVVGPLRALRAEGHDFFVCPVNVAEVYAGLYPREERVAEDLFASVSYSDIDFPSARLAGRVWQEGRQRGVTLDLRDLLIGSTAFHLGAILLTANVTDFPIPGLKLQALPER
ncbi:MAG: type II toxin-antitoxin system VapC family toxin [Chloroflexi bacterium]|nr:type II toxin-antitoxin system VapC family toxin [Chloroflexota bacterium]